MKIGIGVVFVIIIGILLCYSKKSMSSVGYLNLLIPQFSFDVAFFFFSD